MLLHRQFSDSQYRHSATIVAALLATTSPAAAATWTVMPSQAVGTDSSFHDVAAVSATDGWAAPPAAAAH